jgi:hypothetical protein
MKSTSIMPVALLAILCGCTPTERVAEPDLIMKSALSAEAMAPCLARQLGRQFGDSSPDLKRVPAGYEIAVSAPRGALLGYATVEPREGQGSSVRFYNGDLYWHDRQTSGFYPDIARDNWHRAERAFDACDEAES